MVQKNKEKKVSTPDQWKQNVNKGRTITLPSGSNVEIKTLNLMECAAIGYIPLELMNVALDIFEKIRKDPGDWVKLKKEELNKLIDMLRKTATKAVINPSVSEKEGDGAMPASDISLNDLLFIFHHATEMEGGQEAEMEPFREE